MGLLQLIETAGAELSRWAGEHPVRAVLAVVAVVIFSTVTVKRLELPVYKWVHNWVRDWLNARLDGLGKRLNAGLDSKVSSLTETVAVQSQLLAQLSTELQEQKATADRRRADDYRREILRFNREIMEGDALDRESYVEILAVIDRYDGYCTEHPDYPNSRATAAIQNIKTHYQHRLKVGFCKEVTHGQNHRFPGGPADQCS